MLTSAHAHCPDPCRNRRDRAGARGLARLWPAAAIFDLLDTSLSADRERDGELTAAMIRRIGDLASYAERTGAAGILFTCSAFGDAIEAAARASRVPVLKPNEAMFDAALD